MTTEDIDIDITICGWSESHNAKVKVKRAQRFKGDRVEWEIQAINVKGIDITRLITSDQIQEIVNYLGATEELCQ